MAVVATIYFSTSSDPRNPFVEYALQHFVAAAYKLFLQWMELWVFQTAFKCLYIAILGSNKLYSYIISEED